MPQIFMFILYNIVQVIKITTILPCNVVMAKENERAYFSQFTNDC